MKLFLLFLLAFMALAAYIRLAPSYPDRWHIDPSSVDAIGPTGILQKMPVELASFDAVAQSASRIRVLAGSVFEGHITYVARSRILGFPDFITVKKIDGEILIYSRQRFGSSDMGVNAGRLDQWRRTLGLSDTDVTVVNLNGPSGT